MTRTLHNLVYRVDFSVNGENAASIYAESALADGASKRIIAALFAFFLGVFGAHKFYLGRTKEGVIMLLVFLLGFVLFGLPSLIIAIIAFVEFVLYLIKSDEQFEQLYVLDKKAWF